MKDVRDMTTFELSRWSALYEAVNFIADECADRGENFQTIKLEPLYIRKYVESTCDNFARQIDAEAERQAEKTKFVQEEAQRIKQRLQNDLHSRV